MFFSIRSTQKVYKNPTIFSCCLPFFTTLLFFRPPYTMVRPLPAELQNLIKSLLLQNTPFSVIIKRYSSVSLSTLIRYKKFLFNATLPTGGWPTCVSVPTQQYIARMLWNGRQDNPKAVQEYLRLIEFDMSFSGVRKLLKRMGFKPRRKIKANFISKKNQASSAGMSQKNTRILR